MNPQTRSADTPADEHEVDKQDPNAPEPLAQSLLEPVQSATAVPDPKDDQLSESGSQLAHDIRERVITAISQIAADAGEFYAKVQRWRRIPRAFEVLAWTESDIKEGSGVASGNSSTVVLSRKSVQGWLIAELSRTAFKDEPLDMDLVEYVLGLLELPEFCQPDLLVLELYEFLGGDVTVC